MAKWIPNYIRRDINYKAHEILTAKEFNALLNLLITQGDYNSSWLEYLQNDGIPQAIADLSGDQIEKALTEAVAAELASLAASVVNKTAAHLNAPTFSFLNLSTQADMSDFRTVMEEYGIRGNFCVATNLIGLSATYPSLLTVQSMRVAGHEILPVGTDGSSFDRLEVNEIEDIVANAKAYMQRNIADVDVFVYPGGSNSENVQQGVSSAYTYAVNITSDDKVVDSDLIRFNNLRLQIPVIYLSANSTLASAKVYIDTAIANNLFCIVAVDTSKTEYDENALREVLNYLKTQAGIRYKTISTALSDCEETINNQLKDLYDQIAAERVARVNWEEAMAKAYDIFKESINKDVADFKKDIKEDTLQNCYIDYKNEAGEVQEEKYLHW